MFSFFKKKPSPPSSPEQSPIPTIGPSDNDYVLVDPRNRDPNNQPQPLPQSALYPNFDRNFGVPSNINNPIPSSTSNVPSSPPIINYLNGIPFKLSSELSYGNSDEITKIQVDDILALITAKLEVKENDDYDFGLERSIIQENLNEC